MNLPKPELDREESMKLWKNEHSEYAKEQFALNNMGIIGFVLRSLNLDDLDEDLFATGLLGLTKAINTFDFEKGFSFSTYAITVIKNEVLMCFRNKRISISFSLDELKDTGNGKEVSYADMIPSDLNIEDDIVANILTNQILSSLTERERKIIELISFQRKTQSEVANIMGTSQSWVSRMLEKARNKLKKELDN